MNNKPKIYATCSAGCLWETVHKDELEKFSSHVVQYPNSNGNYILEINKDYKIYAPKGSTNNFKCNVGIKYKEGDSSALVYLSLINNDEYAEGFVFRMLGYKVTGDNTVDFYYEFAGARYKDEIVVESTDVTLEYVIVKDATAVYAYSSEAVVVDYNVTAIEESSEDGGSNIVTFPNGATMTVHNGSKGEKGDTGATGTSASWFTGTEITGMTSGIPAIITGAKVGDMYLNTSTSYVYQAISSSLWSYVCSIKGEKGDTGEKGDKGETGDAGATGAQGVGITGITIEEIGLVDGVSITSAEIELV